MGTDLEEIFRCCLKRQEENGKSRDHKRHSPVPFQQEPYHPQKKIHGTNSVTGEEFDIECDSGVAPLIRSLNSHGVKTMFSCQGGIIPSGKRKLPYLVLEATSPDLLAFAVRKIKKFWHDKLLSARLDDKGRIIVSAYDDRQDFIKCLEKSKLLGIGF